jgi:hypothetical protein
VTQDLAATAARIEALITALDAAPDSEARRQAADLTRETMTLYGAALTRMLAIVREHDSGNAATMMLQQFVSDPAVATVLALHDLTPPIAPTPQLVQIQRARPREHPASTCEQCGSQIADAHRHLVDVEERRLMCSCAGCWERTQSGFFDRIHAVPVTSAPRPTLHMTDAHWDALQIPVGLAFFVVNGRTSRTFAFYPSPAGAVESLLSLDAWRDLTELNPWLASVAADVEAVVVRSAAVTRQSWQSAVVPIDACYDLIGRIRVSWKGFDGGDGVRRAVDGFFDEHATGANGALSLEAAS